MYVKYVCLTLKGSEANDAIGKQASKVRMLVCAMLAAIVIQRVPDSHSLLWANPMSE